jgi:hypothetical protein
VTWDVPGVHPQLYRFGPLKLSLVEMSPWRTYRAVRNVIYFWLYECKPRHLKPIIRTIFAIAFTFVLRPLKPQAAAACLHPRNAGRTNR